MSNLKLVTISQVVGLMIGFYTQNDLFMDLGTGGLLALITVAFLDSMEKSSKEQK